MTLNGVLETVRRFRERDQTTPIVLMGYLNLLLTHGLDAFGRDAAAAGVDAHMQGHGATLTERNIFLFGFDGSNRISEIGIFFQNEDAIERFFGA